MMILRFQNGFKIRCAPRRLAAAMLAALTVWLAPAVWAAGGTNLTAAALAPAGTNGVAAGADATAFTNQLNVLDNTYHLAIGDQLSFRIIEDEDDPRILVVTDSGELEVPYIGRYPAEGKTCKQLAQELKAALEKEYYKQATVIIAVDAKPKSRGKVYLVGAVRAPGPLDIPGDETLTVAKAILRSGGLTPSADGKDVRLTRNSGKGGPEKKYTINVSRIYEKGATENDMTLQPGDLIYVPERMIQF